jgi:endonuclease V-like protein UPF0215 family
MKREIRVLGLDGCNRRFVVGVVTRGGLYLDGVFTLEKAAKSSVLARKVTETKYFPELRTIMIHGSTPALDAGVIERTTLLPVITVPVESQGDDRGYKTIEITGRRISVKTRMDSKILLDILSLTVIRGLLPEPIRIAHLLAKMSLSNPHQTR